MKIVKTEDLTNIQILNEGLSKMKLPSFCDLVNNINCFNYFENITIMVNLLTLYNYQELTGNILLSLNDIRYRVS
jgi:hypothetical protein